VQVETLYQTNINGTYPFGKECYLTGDVNQNQNGFQYEIKGTNANASLGNSTWTQRNIIHENRRIRKIFRFALADAPKFPNQQIPEKYKRATIN
jgi:hypothetical protein